MPFYSVKVDCALLGKRTWQGVLEMCATGGGCVAVLSGKTLEDTDQLMQISLDYL